MLVVGIGELLWDMLPDGRKVGGAPANFSYHAVGQGAEGITVSAVGTDLSGNELIDAIERRRVRDSKPDRGQQRR